MNNITKGMLGFCALLIALPAFAHNLSYIDKVLMGDVKSTPTYEHSLGKVVNGFKFDVCRYGDTHIDYCNPKTAKLIIDTAKASKKGKFLNKYNVITFRVSDKKLSALALVDLKNKKVFTAPVEFETGTKVTFDNNKAWVIIHADTYMHQGWNYYNGGRAYHRQDPLWFHEHDDDLVDESIAPYAGRFTVSVGEGWD